MLLRLVTSPLGYVVKLGLAGLLTWQGFRILTADEAPSDETATRTSESALEDVCERVVKRIVDDLKTNAGEIRQVTLGVLDDDPDEQVTQRLQQALTAGGVFEVKEKTTWEKALEQAGFVVKPGGILERVAASARGGDGKQGVLFGKVWQLEDRHGGAIVDVEITLARAAAGSVDFSRRYVVDTSRPPTADDGDSATPGKSSFSWRAFGSWLLRLLAWAMLVLLLPVFTISFLRLMVAKQSNGANAFTLVIYLFVDAVLAVFLVGAGAVTSLGGGIVLLICLTLAFIYNAQIMSFAHRLETA